jgi:hypothetical protein
VSITQVTMERYVATALFHAVTTGSGRITRGDP